DINIYEIKDIILRTVTPLESLKGKVVSGGMLNAGSALSFDKNHISINKKKAASPVKNSAPVVESSLFESQGETLLMIRVVDADDDIQHMLITPGLRKMSYFGTGAKDISRFSVNEHGLVFYRVQEKGIYTVLITDEAGHMTLEHIATYKGNLGPGVK
ncbi:MAG: hypothetical protein IIV75_04975, partial [Lachnospiraceae bacterium]|nr:hypothetical protein [Lachnospiraceae bacterium]